MLNKKILDEIGSKVTEILEHSPAKDVEKNFKVMLTSVFSKLDLVTREEFDIQQEVLLRTRENLTTLETKVAALEKQFGVTTPEATSAASPDDPTKSE